MMIIQYFDIQQDTVPARNSAGKDSVKLKTDSLSVFNPLQSKDTIPLRKTSKPDLPVFVFADTTAACSRNSIADITFYDSNNIVSRNELICSPGFPMLFLEKNWQTEAEARTSLLHHLKPGQRLPVQPLHADWIILIILTAAFLYSFIRTSSTNILPGITRFFLLRGITDPSSRDTGGLFHWQSTILNLISFLIIALFAYGSAAYYNIIPEGVSGLLFWLISLGIIITTITLRHIVCEITGNISGAKEVFREYLFVIYQSYRFSALFLFIIVLLMSYTVFFPAGDGLISGIVVLGIMYLISAIRLMIIFLNRNISIFYLILYLCALEILPVVISVKYFSGLV
jgi:hypothetical protein